MIKDDNHRVDSMIMTHGQNGSRETQQARNQKPFPSDLFSAARPCHFNFPWLLIVSEDSDKAFIIGAFENQF